MYINPVETKERLIEATRELLWERGYVGTSPRAIQKRSRAGQGSMYHHFAGKPDLALAALRRSVEDLQSRAEAVLSGPGSAFDRISNYLLLERDVLRGCRMGRLAQDPEIIADPRLRQPLEEIFWWLQHRLSDVLREGQERKEISAEIDPATTAATIAATLQGGYILARAGGSVEPFHQAIQGLLHLLAVHAVIKAK